jgi:hydroxyacylglutathione hydrolase
MRVVPIPCLSDNYAYLLVCPETKEAAIVDASEAGPVLRAVEDAAVDPRGRPKVKAILATHHHFDHVGGNEEVARALGIDRIYGSKHDEGRIPGQTEGLEDGDSFMIGKLHVRALAVPGHTLGALAYVVTSSGGEDPAVFTGDTLFLAGCGRLFEGDPPTMHASLEKLRTLDPRTRVFCGHEYTESNLRFAQHVEPSSRAVAEARTRAAEARRAGRPTVPGTIEAELLTNPFFRVDSPEIRATLGVIGDAPPADALGAIRKAKDTFRG